MCEGKIILLCPAVRHLLEGDEETPWGPIRKDQWNHYAMGVRAKYLTSGQAPLVNSDQRHCKGQRDVYNPILLHKTVTVI